jgi:hypothetical protein
MNMTLWQRGSKYGQASIDSPINAYGYVIWMVAVR